MSDETSRRLSKLLWWERIKKWAGIASLFLVLLVPYLAIMEYRVSHADVATTRDRVEGVVSQARPSGAGRSYIVNVRLADGRQVDASSVLRIAPIKGAHVLVDDTGHKSGRHSYAVVQIKR